VPSHDYAATGSKILELVKYAHNPFIREDPHERARLRKTLGSNSTFGSGSLSVAYVKPLDLLAEGERTGNWLRDRDSNRWAAWLAQTAFGNGPRQVAITPE
jgi:hypothetical protein